MLAVLAACDGADDSSSAAASTTTSVPVTVIDGAIKGAVVCLDKNGNGICDAGEPTATTDASGNATLTVDNADVGQYAIVAMVGTSATDADSGPVMSAYVLQAPADQTAVVSPLTTMVVAQQRASGGTSATAATQVQTLTGLTASPFTNYTLTASTSADAAAAANLARLIVLTAQQQATALASVVGQVDSTGATITQAELQSAIVKAMVGALPALASAATTTAVTGATTATARDTALASAAASLVANDQAGLDATSAPAVIGYANLTPDTSSSSSTITATATLRMVTFTDANNWFFHANESTVADNTPDSNGLVHWYDNRTSDTAGTLVSWGFNNTVAGQGDLHWNGSAWVGCPFGFRSSQLPRDANGFTQYNYCDSDELGTSQRASMDISGKALTDVVATIRAYPGSDSGIAYTQFGPTNLSLLGTATFPTGSTLFYYTNQSSAEALSYLVTSPVDAYSVAVAAGGDVTSNASLPCNGITSTNYTTYYTVVSSLEDLVARNPGSACHFGSTKSGYAVANDWWGNSTISVGSIAGAITPTAPIFSTAEQLRLAFNPTGQVVTYLSCQTLVSGGGTWDCTTLGTGTYVIQTLGDGRALTLTNLPPELHRFSYAPVFVERGGGRVLRLSDFRGRGDQVGAAEHHGG